MRTAFHYLFVVLLLATAAPATARAAAVSTPETASIQPSSGALVGVACPITVTFSEAVTDRQAAQRSIRITAPNRPTGGFTWITDRVAQWQPAHYWPAHTRVKVQVHALTTDFETGDLVTGVASLSAHTFTVSINDQVIRTMPASMGKPTRPTPVGSFTALEKQRSVVMDSRTIGIPLNSSEGYLITAQYAVRVTWGGVYVHSAPWSVNSQGNANVSHGCINLSPDNAAWYFDTVHVGDPIIVDP